MRNRLLALVLLFFGTFVLSMLTFFVTSQVAIGPLLGLPKAAGALAGFVVLFGVTSLASRWLEPRCGALQILLAVGGAVVAMVVLNFVIDGLRVTGKMLPLYLSWVLGLVAARLRLAGEGVRAALLVAFPLAMLFVFDGWSNRFEYGTWTGEVERGPVAQFEFVDAEGRVIDSASLEGRVVMLEFWFSSCLSCRKKFPELQRIHEQYAGRTDFRFLAVNRGEEPAVAFGTVADAGYSFPVVRGDPDAMDALGIESYPTVMLLNPRGEIVFKGPLDGATERIEPLLASL